MKWNGAFLNLLFREVNFIPNTRIVPAPVAVDNIVYLFKLEVPLMGQLALNVPFLVISKKGLN